MRDEEVFDKKEESIAIQPRLYSFDNSWDNVVMKLKQTDSIKFPIIIDQVVRSGGLFYITLITGQLLRWNPDEVTTNLIVLEPPVGYVSGGTGTYFENSDNKRSSQTPQIFVDQTGDHALIVQNTGETWYLHSSQIKARHIQKLSNYTILSVAWNNWETSRNSAVSVIIGCKKGTILTTILGPDISPSSTVIRVLHEISDTPILGVMLDSILMKDSDHSQESQNNETSLNKLQYVVSVSTPKKLFLWFGQNRIIDLFVKNDHFQDSSRFCLEIGSTEAASLTSKIRLLEITNYHFLVWINSREISIYYVNRSKHTILEACDYIGQVNKYNFCSNSNKIPNSVECSRYHIIALFEDYLDVISPITARSIYKVSIVSIPGQLVVGGEVIQDLQLASNTGGISTIKSLAIELSSSFNNLSILRSDSSNNENLEILDKISFIWGYNNDNMYKINIINEGGALWKEWLYIGMYEEAILSTEKISSTTHKSKKKSMIRRLQFFDLLRKGQVSKAAQLLSTIDDELSFNEICNMFIQSGCWEGLIVYLTCKLQQLKSNHKDPMTTNTVYQDETIILKFVVISLWLVELNSFVSFSQGEKNFDDKYYSSLIGILKLIYQIDEIEAKVYQILTQYNRRIAIQYYSDLRRDWHVLVQEYICFGIMDPILVRKCFEIFVSIGGNVSKRDKLLIQYSPILAFLDPKRFLSLLKRPSFTSIDMNLILPYLLDLVAMDCEYKDQSETKNEREELDKLAILLIENFLNMNCKQRNQSELERVSTRVKLMLHTDTWRGNKTIWNVLAILCSRLDEGEELLLSYITPLLTKAKMENCSLYDVNLQEPKLEMEFDLSFLLNICNTKQYKKLKAYVYCLLGFYDSAMSVCLKELNNTKLTKDIIYNFIESYDQRRKWILNLIKPLGYNRDIQGLTKLLAASPKHILTLSDVLLVIPDDIQLSFLSNIITNNINQFDELLLKRAKIYESYKQSRENLLIDLFSCHNSYNVVDPQNDICFVCYRGLFNYQGFTFEDVREFAHYLRISHLDQVHFSSLMNFFLVKSKYQNENLKYTGAGTNQGTKMDNSNNLQGFDEDQYYKFLNDDLNSNILLFPCSHSFHFGCMLLKFTSLMNNDEINKITRIIEGICKHSAIYIKNYNKNIRPQLKYDANSNPSNNISSNILTYQESRKNSNKNRSKKSMNMISVSDYSSNSVLESLFKQLISLVNNDCLICGELMIRNIDKPFITEESQNIDINNFCI